LSTGTFLARDCVAQDNDISTSTGLVGYWPFSEGMGASTANALRESPDLFGNSGAARIVGPAWVKGKHGNALDFSGSKTAVLVEKTKELGCDKQVSIAAWVKLARPKGRCMILNHSYSYRLCVNQGRKRRVRFQLSLDGNWAGNWLIGKTSLDEGRWYHVAGVYDGKERRIYINGKLDAAKPAKGAIGNGRDFAIGASRIKSSRKRTYKTGEKVSYQVAEPFAGVIDEVKVWNRAISAKEVARAANENHAKVLAMLGGEKSLYFYAVKCVAMLGKDLPYEIAVFNSARGRFAGSIVSAISDMDGRKVFEKPHQIAVGPREKRTIGIPFKPKAAGSYKLKVLSQTKEVFETSLLALAPRPRSPVGEPELRKVLTVDLTKDMDDDVFCHDGTSKIVRSHIGSYREAGPKKFSRFVARLPLDRTGLHLVRVTYPDDKARVCEIASSSPVGADRFNAHTGYFTGGDYPLSGKFQTFEFVMWARHTDQALVFTSWLDRRPAAASRIEVFEIDGRLPSRPASRAGDSRYIGHYWEDAQPLSRCFGGSAPELADFDKMVGNMCDYFDYTGQNIVMHPVLWYGGPIYNSLVEARGDKGGFHFPTSGWLDIVLERFEERGLKFYGLFNVHDLSSLKRTMNGDIKRVQAGEPTFNSVSKDNDVFIKTWHHRASMFNALHPRVQERVLALVEELAERYSRSPAFAGLGFHLTMAQLLQPGGLEVSYDDWTVGQFESDTGLEIPVSAKDPKRFGKRYEWIMQHAKDRWIRWRCERVAEYYGKVAGILRGKRKDLRFVVTILEPPMAIMDPQRLAWMGGKRLVELSREGGIDPVLLAQHPGVIIQQRLGPTAKIKRLASGITRGRWGCPPPTPESIDAVRGMDFAEEQQKEYKTTDEFAVFMYNRYFESAVGRHRPLKSDWFKSIPWRATAIVPAHEHFMEYYAHAMAVFDPAIMAVGGFTNGTIGHGSRVERFARVFRRLPQGKWEEMGGLPDGVVGRTLDVGGRTYLYLVNRRPAKARVFLNASKPMKPLGGSPSLVKKKGGHTVEIGPYQLAAWVGTG